MTAKAASDMTSIFAHRPKRDGVAFCLCFGGECWMVYVLSRQSDWKQDDTKLYYLWWRCWLDQKQRQTPASLVVGRLVSVLGPVLLVELFIVNNIMVHCKLLGNSQETP